MTREKNEKAFEPIRDSKDIQKIRSLLQNNLRDLLLFDLGTQTGLRVKDLLTLRVRDLSGLKTGDRFIKSSNTGGNHQVFIMSDMILHTLNRFLEESKLDTNDYLFKSRKGNGPLNISSVSHMVKGWSVPLDEKNLVKVQQWI